MEVLRTSLDKATMGHFKWELLRRADPPILKPGSTEGYWVAVAVEFAGQSGGALVRQDVLDWIAAIEAKGCEANVGSFEKDRLEGEFAAGATKARITLLIARAMLDVLPTFPTASFDVTALSVGEPFWKDKFTFEPNTFPRAAFVTATSDAARQVTDARSAEPLVGIIDDGIAFLNRRFCARTANGFDTRFNAVWIQTESTEASGFVQDVPFGFVFEPDFLNWMLANGRTDTEWYRLVNDLFYPPPSQQATNTHLAHGTHVLDLAAGADPSVGGPPLIAVQLAPGTAMGTSGRRLEMFLVMGLRWMVHRAVKEGRDLVVNISLGTLAGPGDATNFVADAIAREIEAFERLTEAAGAKKRMRVVIAYGNSWRGDLVAEFGLDSTTRTRSVDWHILPDGHSSSYLELRVPREAEFAGTDIEVTVTPPGGLVQSLVWTFGQTAPTAPVKTHAGGAVAQIFPLPEESNALAALIAVAPTASLTPGDAGLAPAGIWRVEVKLPAGKTKCAVTLRVQRNDTPTGYRIFGRQSWLGDAGMGAWDGEMRDYTEPGKDSAVRRDGTANAYAGLPDVSDGGSIYYVGAVRPDAESEAEKNDKGVTVRGMRKALYTSEGIDEENTERERSINIESHGPTLAAKGDDGRFFPGRLATSVAGGLRSQRLSGTSVSAGLVTRRVAEFLAGQLGAGPELEAVLSGPRAPTRDTRIGFGVIRETT